MFYWEDELYGGLVLLFVLGVALVWVSAILIAIFRRFFRR